MFHSFLFSTGLIPLRMCNDEAVIAHKSYRIMSFRTCFGILDNDSARKIDAEINLPDGKAGSA